MADPIYTFTDAERHLIAAAQQRAREAEMAAAFASSQVSALVSDILQYNGVQASSVQLATDNSAVFAKQ